MNSEIIISHAGVVPEVLGAAELFTKSLGHWTECLNVTIFVLIATHGQ